MTHAELKERLQSNLIRRERLWEGGRGRLYSSQEVDEQNNQRHKEFMYHVVGELLYNSTHTPRRAYSLCARLVISILQKDRLRESMLHREIEKHWMESYGNE